MSKKTIVLALRILYPVWAIVGLFGIMYVPGKLIVAGNAAATANNLMANELLFRLGIVGSLVTQLIFIFVVLLLYKLFESVSKNQAALMVVFALVAVPIAMLNELSKIGALLALNGPNQMLAQMMLFLDLNAQGIFIASIFWGLWLLPLAYLIYKSGFFPKILGVLMMLAGVGYVIDSFMRLILPTLAETIYPVTGLMIMGEIIFMFWVLIKGVKVAE
jgi:hypothetical protein